MKHTCWYRVSVFRSSNRDLSVSAVAAVKPNPGYPTKDVLLPNSRSTRKVLDLPGTFMPDIYAIAGRIDERAKADFEAMSVLRKELFVDPQLLEWLGVKARIHDPIVNFFWLGCRIPYGKGQKAKARKMVDILRGYSEEFSELFELDVEVQADDQSFLPSQV